jgi:hypothetical protein
MPRGRPLRSEIRQNIIDILNVMGKGYGYEIYRVYREVFPECTLESVYYHLKRGVKTEELRIREVRQETGDFSWGPVSEKIIYELGPAAKPRHNSLVDETVHKLQLPEKAHQDKELPSRKV